MVICSMAHVERWAWTMATASREWHISALLSRFGECETLIPNELYSISIGKPNCVAVLIDLPPNFPTAAPVISCTPMVHELAAYLDQKTGQVTNHPYLSPWCAEQHGQSMLLLIISDLQQRILGKPEPSAAAATTAAASFECDLSSEDMRVVNSLTDDQVSDLLASSDKFTRFFSNLPSRQTAAAASCLAELTEENVRMAKSNLRIGDELADLKRELSSALKQYEDSLSSFNNFLILNDAGLKATTPARVVKQVEQHVQSLDEASRLALEKDELSAAIAKRKEFHRQQILLKLYQQHCSNK